ncbi:MAG TPA: DNA-3-methyladenine glycosylase [Patescibacteria group bacterium]|nr:DNA-3-methyladenine glycosylase [Patescibacteria group bacterium]
MRLNFFARPTLKVAPELLGMRLAVGDKSGIITEVEAYIGEEDEACHARFGRTGRSQTLYTKPGTVYVYLCYGTHWMLNIVTEKEHFPAAILIRGIAIFDPILKSYFLNPKSRLSGPGRVTKFLGIDKTMNGQIVNGGDISIGRGIPVDPADIKKGPRVGISYAGEPWLSHPWRFWI